MQRWEAWSVLARGMALVSFLPALVSAVQEAHVSPRGARLLDEDGRLHVLGDVPDSKGFCLVILGIGCPVSNEILPELGRLSSIADESGIQLFGVLSDPFARRSEAVKLHARFALTFPLLFDANGVMAERLQPRTTPEAFLFDARGSLVYRGRIDNRSLDQSGANTPGRRDLQAALEELSRGKPVAVPFTGAIGCAYEGWGEPVAEDLTWANNVAPILVASCVDCHRNRGAAPFSLVDYADAARRSKMIARVARERTMPPWHAAPGFGDLVGVRELDEREIRVLELWSAAGAKRGDDSEAPVRLFESAEMRLCTPDLVLTVPDAISLPADGPDLLRLFLVPTGLTKDRWVRAVEFRFEDPRLVRQALLFASDERQCSAQGTDMGKPGYDAIDGQGLEPTRYLARWLPGNEAEPLPGGVGRRLERESDLKLWLHLHASGVAETTGLSIALWFDVEPAREEVVLDVIRSAGAPLLRDAHDGFRIHVEHRLAKGSRLLAVIPKMDSLGMEMKLVARLPDGKELPLVRLIHWDVFRPERFRFRTPMELPAGTNLVLDARFDDPGRTRSIAVTMPELLESNAGVAEHCRCYLELIEALPRDLLPEKESSAGGR